MTIIVKQVQGPNEGAFLYLQGSHQGYPHVTRVRSVALAALASGALTIATEKAALIAEVEQAIINWSAAQAALADL